MYNILLRNMCGHTILIFSQAGLCQGCGKQRQFYPPLVLDFPIGLDTI